MSDTKTSASTAYQYAINTFTDGTVLTAKHLNDMQDNVNTALGNIEAIVGNTNSTGEGTLLDRVNQLAASSAVSELSSTVSNLSDTVDGLSSDVGTLKAIVGTVGDENGETLVSKVETLETQSNGIDSRVGTLETQVAESTGGTGNTIADRLKKTETQLAESTNGTGNTIADQIAESKIDIATLEDEVTALKKYDGGLIKHSDSADGWNAPIVYGTSLSNHMLQPGQIYLEYAQ